MNRKRLYLYIYTYVFTCIYTSIHICELVCITFIEYYLFINNTLPYYSFMNNTYLYSRTRIAFFCKSSHKVMANPQIFLGQNGGFHSFFCEFFHKVMEKSQIFSWGNFIYFDRIIEKKNMPFRHKFMEGSKEKCDSRTALEENR